MANDVPPTPGLSRPTQQWNHDWHPLDSYLNLHHSYIERLTNEGVILDNHLTFTLVEDNGLLIEVNLAGIIECVEDVFIAVDKSLDVRLSRNGQPDVRGLDYAYHAYLKLDPVRNLIRYCSAHGMEDLHCHVFDPASGLETGRPNIELSDLPTLGEFIPLAVDLGRRAKLV